MKTQHNKAQTVERIIHSLREGSFTDALNALIKSKVYLDEEAALLCGYLNSSNSSELLKKNPAESEAFLKIQSVAFLSVIHRNTINEQSQAFSEINKTGIPKKDVLEAILFCCHLSAIPFFEGIAPTKHENVLAAAKLIYGKLNTEEKGDKITATIMFLLFNLLRSTCDNLNNLKNFELILHDNYSLTYNEKSGYTISYEKKNAPSAYKLEILKLNYEAQQRFIEAESALKEETYIQHIDKIYGANQGFPGIFHSSNVKMVDSNPGIRAIQVDDDFFNLDKDPQKATEKLMGAFIPYYYPYRLRTLLKSIYNPSLKVDIKIKIEVGNGNHFTLYELLLIQCALLPLSELMKTYSVSILQLIESCRLFVKERNIEMGDEEFKSHCLSAILSYYCHDKAASLTDFMLQEPIDLICQRLLKIEGLAHRSDNDIKQAILFLSRTNSELPFNLYYLEDGVVYSYLFKEDSMVYLKKFYDYVLAPQLFDSINGQDGKQRKNGVNREKMVSSYLERIFQTITPHCKSGVYLTRPNGKEERVEKDFFAYYEKENVIFYAEVKLNNVLPRKAFKKREWIQKNLIEEAKRQISESLKILSSPQGMHELGCQIGIFNLAERAPTIHSFALCDCYFADHMKVELQANLGSFTVVNIFEIESIIKGRSIGEGVIPVSEPLVYGELKKLISALKADTFWQPIYSKKDQPFETYECRSFAKNLILKTYI